MQADEELINHFPFQQGDNGLLSITSYRTFYYKVTLYPYFRYNGLIRIIFQSSTIYTDDVVIIISGYCLNRKYIGYVSVFVFDTQCSSSRMNNIDILHIDKQEECI